MVSGQFGIVLGEPSPATVPLHCPHSATKGVAMSEGS